MEGLREALDTIPAVDHHAHLLSRPDAGFTLTDVLSESRDAGQRQRIRDHPSHSMAVRDLRAFLDADPEDARRRQGFAAVTRRLLEGCRLGGMLVDDGFRFPGALSLEEHSALVGCPVHRIVRIETVAERSATGWPAFGEVRDRFRADVAEAVERGAVALKTIAAYRCGLALPPADAEEAAGAYVRWSTGGGDARLVEPALIAFFLAEALDATRRRPVPLQVHTGFGDADLSLHRADPSLLRPLLEAARVPVVLLHCYPFVRQASYLAGVYPHVYVDLSLTLPLIGHRGPDLVLEAWDLAPTTKLLFATDASRLAEMFYLGARWWRDALAGALGRLVEDGTVDGATALRWAELILAGTARQLYGL